MTRDGESLSVDLTDEQIARLDALAATSGRTREEEIVECIRIGLLAEETSRSAGPGTPS